MTDELQETADQALWQVQNDKSIKVALISSYPVCKVVRLMENV